MNFHRIFLAIGLAAPLSACSISSSPELNSEQLRKIDGDTVYIVTRQDTRKCMSPYCGGVYVKAVNKNKTTCFDGSKQQECYVGDFDFSALELPENQAYELRNTAISGHVLLSGELTELTDGIAKLTTYKAFEHRTEAVATGDYFLLNSSGIVCITTPCPSLQANKLNTDNLKEITDLDFSQLGLSDEELSATYTTIYETGLVVSGDIKKISGHKYFIASQIFDTVEAEPMLCLSDDDCGTGSYCDTSECLSGCAPDMICTEVCYGSCESGSIECPETDAICDAICAGEAMEVPDGCPLPSCACPELTVDSCSDACGGTSLDQSCYCDDACEYYGDCCSDYVAQCY